MPNCDTKPPNFLHSYTGKENIQTQVFVNNGYFDCELIMVRPKEIRRGKFKGVGHWVMPGGRGHLEHRQMPPLNTPRINCTVHKIQPHMVMNRVARFGRKSTSWATFRFF